MGKDTGSSTSNPTVTVRRISASRAQLAQLLTGPNGGKGAIERCHTRMDLRPPRSGQKERSSSAGGQMLDVNDRSSVSSKGVQQPGRSGHSGIRTTSRCTAQR